MIRALAMAAAVCAASCGGGETSVSIENPDTGDTVLAVDADRATTAAERMRGLRGHEPLGPDEGLLIELPVATEVCIVNDGVTFAIDVVYAGEDNRVVAIERRIPAEDPTARCVDSVRRVLEVSAGVAASVQPGYRLVIH